MTPTYRLLALAWLALSVSGCDSTADGVQENATVVFGAYIQGYGDDTNLFGLAPDNSPTLLTSHREDEYIDAPQCSSNGSIAFQSSGPDGMHVPSLWWFDGTRPRRIANPEGDGPLLGTLGSGAWSPDGQRLVLTECVRLGFEGCDRGEAKVFDTRSNALTTLGVSGGNSIWDPQGERIAYQTARDIWTIQSDGTSPVQVTTGLGSSTAPILALTWGPGLDEITVQVGHSSEHHIVDLATGALRAFPAPPDGTPVWSVDWARDGLSYLYITSRQRGSVFDPEIAEYTVESGETQVLFETTSPNGIGRAQWCDR